MINGNQQKKLLVIDQKQFGYHNITYYICKLLQEKFCITYFGWDFNQKKLLSEKISVIYLSKKGNLIKRFIKFFKNIRKLINTEDYDLIYINYFQGSFLFPLLYGKRKFILDIRTGSVYPGLIKRFFLNILLKIETIFFSQITIISESLANKLVIPKSKYKVIPLGAHIVNKRPKELNKIYLLYIGTLNNRNIEKTIEGFSLFLRKVKNDILIKYTIIGTGKEKYLNKIKKAIIDKNLEKKVKLLGTVPQNEINKYLEEHNIGVSYIPMKKYFDFQPATKTYEYLLAGMPVIATNTYENAIIINESNGVLVNDGVYDFHKGLLKLYNNRSKFNAKNIIENMKRYTWDNIIYNDLLKLFNNLIDK